MAVAVQDVQARAAGRVAFVPLVRRALAVRGEAAVARPGEKRDVGVRPRSLGREVGGKLGKVIDAQQVTGPDTAIDLVEERQGYGTELVT